MVKTMIKERRGCSRTTRILSIEYRLYKSRRQHSDPNWHLSTTEDVSPAGLSFYSDYEYRPGDILDVRVVMSGLLEVFKGPCEVVRAEQKRLGACFFIALRFASFGQDAGTSPASRPKRITKRSYPSTKRI
ncbi:MAG: PilZ domain-containing protein [Candidatus Omnitrophica bacterium]|nr:PilZ domain-containing protein [Candidatus Omnitrophota bacterium]